METDDEHHHRPLDEEEKLGLSLLEISEMEGHLMNMFYGSREVVFDCHHCGHLFREFNWYQCESDGCEYILHPTCAKSPVDIPSFLHPYLGHDLEVITGCNTTSCAVCNTNGQNKMYGCKVCDFYIHPTCSLWPKSLFFHELHPKPHPLQLQVLFPMSSFDPSPPPSSPPPPPKPPIETYPPPTPPPLPPPPPKWHLLQYKPSTTSPPSPPEPEPLQLQVLFPMPSFDPSPPPSLPPPPKPPIESYPPPTPPPLPPPPPKWHLLQYKPSTTSPPSPPEPEPLQLQVTLSMPPASPPPPPPMPQPIQFKSPYPPPKSRPAIPQPQPPPPPPSKPKPSPPQKEALVFSPPTHPFTCHACKQTSDGLIFYHCGRCNESYHLVCLLRFSLAYKNSHTDLSKEYVDGAIKRSRRLELIDR